MKKYDGARGKCSVIGKLIYMTKTDAKRHVRDLRKKCKKADEGKTVRAYQCPHCRLWHVGRVNLSLVARERRNNGETW